jgi:hypothetical protein
MLNDLERPLVPVLVLLNDQSWIFLGYTVFVTVRPLHEVITTACSLPINKVRVVAYVLEVPKIVE